MTVTDWLRFAPAIHVEPDWLREEIGRQSDGLMNAMTAATRQDDIARQQPDDHAAPQQYRTMDRQGGFGTAISALTDVRRRWSGCESDQLLACGFVV
ncbi:hypothetical protein QX204_23910 [Nocardia sp. PE-7]|uniref:hypothetical protein n=1 Tax=Nocardia sp. PE-7 TaxID=3058426 RepID=UPI002659D609|nr:hypothetical protein [Nocardia sp. PE-7]WKG08098.1 hypothetical protein QX204_23910 [Nocardia sp. PE-7]